MPAFKFACHTIQFGEEQQTNRDKVLRDVAAAGWSAVEGQVVESMEDAMSLAEQAAQYGLHIVNLLGSQNQGIDTVRFNVALGNNACEIPARRRADYGGDTPSDDDFERAARDLDHAVDYAVAHGMQPFHHAHLWTMIETVEDAERLLTHAPKLWLLFDTGHLLARNSDPMRVFDSPILRDRIAHVHLKDFHADDPAAWKKQRGVFWEQGRFAELGQGNMGLDVKAVLQGLEAIGYAGYVSVELDRPYPVKPAAESAKSSREYLRKMGY